MRAPLLLAFAAASLGLVAYALYSLQAPPAPRPRAAPSTAAPRAPAAVSPRSEAPIERIARVAAAAPPIDVEPERPIERAPEPAPELPVSRAATEAAFDALMTELEAIPNARALDPERRAKLYRDANDMLSAMTIQLGEDETEALEEAYMRVQTQVGRLRLRGKR